MKQAILFTTHYVDDQIERRFQTLVDAGNELEYDTYMLLNIKYPFQFPANIDRKKICAYSAWQLSELDYRPIYETLYPGSIHFLVLAFAFEHPDYDYVWFIEYDVCYTGRWASFLNFFSGDDADFIASHVERYNKKMNEDWTWWKLKNAVGFPLEECLKAFCPVCRYSRKALLYIDKYQKQWHSAHFEVLIPTCLYHAEMKIEDFGGTGMFVKEENRNRFYVQGAGTNNGTMRYRPVFLQEEIEALNVKDKLFHPLK